MIVGASSLVCEVKIIEEPELVNPILIEGLPGIGLVANLVTLHLIRSLGAKLFVEISSSAFQGLVTTTHNGRAVLPINELHYYRRSGGSDIIFLYGNTQALTPYGQYELCGRILDVAEKFGCKRIITLGGMRVDEVSTPPALYCAAIDKESLDVAVKYGAKIIRGGHIFGVAGLLLGLGKIRGMRGLCLLGETVGQYPDAEAAYVVMEALQKILKLDRDLVFRLDLKEELAVGDRFMGQPFTTREKKEFPKEWLL